MNNADAWKWEYLSTIASPTSSTFRGKGFFWRERRQAVAAASTYYYGINTSPTKHTVVYARNIYGSEGPITLNLHPAATWTGGDAAVNPFNLFFGRPSADMQIIKNPTGLANMAPTSEVDHDFGDGNNAPVFGTAAPNGGPTIFQPNTKFVLSISNSAAGTITGIVFSLFIVETEIPPWVFSL